MRDKEENTHQDQTQLNREKVSVKTGRVFILDQFMFANPQLLSMLRDSGATRSENGSPQSIEPVIERFGGISIKLRNEDYHLFRDVETKGIAMVPYSNGSEAENDDATVLQTLWDEILNGGKKPVGKVYVHTRCLVIADMSLLSNKSLLDEYGKHWSSGREKSARDLLRKNGAGVRYGFNRVSDDFKVFTINDEILLKSE